MICQQVEEAVHLLDSLLDSLSGEESLQISQSRECEISCWNLHVALKFDRLLPSCLSNFKATLNVNFIFFFCKKVESSTWWNEAQEVIRILDQLRSRSLWCWFNKTMSSYQYRNSNYGDKLILWMSYLKKWDFLYWKDGIFTLNLGLDHHQPLVLIMSIGKMASLHWIWVLTVNSPWYW